jgi:3-dehydroquinate synthase
VPVVPPYPVVVGSGLDLAGEVSTVLEPGVCAVLTDSDVGPLHAGRVVSSLEGAGWSVTDVVEVLAGEPSKSLGTYEEVLRRLAASGLTRDGTLFALGGGVVGDLGGFAAATYMRGIGFVGLPTNLLAMVDSSVGGKTGIDLPEGKNLVGAFVRPRIVVAELDFLSTLPGRQVSCGLAEVLKMGLLSGGEFFSDLELLPAARAGDAEALSRLVLHSVRFKAEVVGEDELEGGRRAILNYGHTAGHGIEAAARYTMLHGEAISAGMVVAALISRERFGRDLVGLHGDLLSAAGLPAKASLQDGPEAVLAAMSTDKKRRAGESGHRFVLLEEVGRPVWGVSVSDEEVMRAIEEVLV